MEPAAQVMGPDAGLHADQAGRHIRQPSLDLAARPLLAHDDRAAPIEADYVERVLADVDAHGGDGRVCIARHGGAPSAGPPLQLTPEGAGARPDHSIIGHERAAFAAMHGPV